MQMDTIYAGAELTIMAAAGDDEDFGLPGVSNKNKRCSMTRDFIDCGSAQFVSFSLDHSNECSRSKWNTRGWTLQEVILSERRLHFTPTQTIFECKECTIPESSYLAEPQIPKADENISRVHLESGRAVLPKDRTSLQYCGLVHEFSSRSLSNEADSFFAFAGIAVYFSKTNPPIFNFCGIPIQFKNDHGEIGLDVALARGLVWNHSRPQPDDLRSLRAPYRRSAFPSWSWAGWYGRVDFENELWHPGETKALNVLRSIGLDNETITFSESPVGSETMRSLAALAVGALHVSAMFLRLGKISTRRVHDNIEIYGQKARVETSEDMELAVVLEKMRSGQLRCLTLLVRGSLSDHSSMVYFMVVQRIDESYRRVGTMRLELHSMPSLKEASNWIGIRSELCYFKLT